MVKGIGLIALCLAIEVAFIFHAALPSGLPRPAAPALARPVVARRAGPAASAAAAAAPRDAAPPPCDPGRRC
jgi:hypothetical protein